MHADHPEMWGPTWSWAIETCSHALRLIFSGTFDRYPGATVILGHMGETLPIQLSRLDSRYPVRNTRLPIEKNPSEYVRSNIRITASGLFSDTALRCALDAMGSETVMSRSTTRSRRPRMQWVGFARRSSAMASGQPSALATPPRSCTSER